MLLTFREPFENEPSTNVANVDEYAILVFMEITDTDDAGVIKHRLVKQVSTELPIHSFCA